MRRPIGPNPISIHTNKGKRSKLRKMSQYYLLICRYVINHLQYLLVSIGKMSVPHHIPIPEGGVVIIVEMALTRRLRFISQSDEDACHKCQRRFAFLLIKLPKQKEKQTCLIGF